MPYPFTVFEGIYRIDQRNDSKIFYENGKISLIDNQELLSIKKDWDMERPQMIADLLAQCSTLQMEARRNGQLNIALGAINTAAKLADLCS